MVAELGTHSLACGLGPVPSLAEGRCYPGRVRDPHRSGFWVKVTQGAGCTLAPLGHEG